MVAVRADAPSVQSTARDIHHPVPDSDHTAEGSQFRQYRLSPVALLREEPPHPTYGTGPLTEAAQHRQHRKKVRAVGGIERKRLQLRPAHPQHVHHPLISLTGPQRRQHEPSGRNHLSPAFLSACGNMSGHRQICRGTPIGLESEIRGPVTLSSGNREYRRIGPYCRQAIYPYSESSEHLHRHLQIRYAGRMFHRQQGVPFRQRQCGQQAGNALRTRRTVHSDTAACERFAESERHLRPGYPHSRGTHHIPYVGQIPRQERTSAGHCNPRIRCSHQRSEGHHHPGQQSALPGEHFTAADGPDVNALYGKGGPIHSHPCTQTSDNIHRSLRILTSGITAQHTGPVTQSGGENGPLCLALGTGEGPILPSGRPVKIIRIG